jgi:hypothetical protein
MMPAHIILTGSRKVLAALPSEPSAFADCFNRIQ